MSLAFLGEGGADGVSLAFLGEVRLGAAAPGSAGDSAGRLAPLAGSAAGGGKRRAGDSQLKRQRPQCREACTVCYVFYLYSLGQALLVWGADVVQQKLLKRCQTETGSNSQLRNQRPHPREGAKFRMETQEIGAS